MFCTVNGVRLYYEVYGTGRPMILVHGNSESHTIFDRSIPELSKTHRVYAVDSRCHGQSSRTEEISYRLMAQDLIAFIRAMELEKPIFYGFSDGGILGLLIAMEEPELLGRLIISGANLNPGGLKLASRLCMVPLALAGNKLYRMMLRQPHIAPEDLGRITVPTVVLAGEHDMVYAAHTRLIARSIPNSTLKILPGERHGSYIVHSGELAFLLRQYL